MRRTLDFTLNGERVSLDGEDPTRTVLSWLREARALTGTKEGCAEGDCGACTVVLAEHDRAGRLRHAPVNACILCLGALDGRELITVEGLKHAGALHPVQQAMAECHGSQCGFCTPGFVMALYAHHKEGQPLERGALCDAIAGNLCRCTGYRPILEAGERAGAALEAQHGLGEDEARSRRLLALPGTPALLEAGARRFFVPATAAELGTFLAEHPKATILAGGTDVGLWLTKQHRDLEAVAYTGRVSELKNLVETEKTVEIGAALTYAEAFPALAAIHPDIGELLRRLGAVQVRSSGTLAGNIANASPIGDSMPVLLALDAVLVLQQRESVRELKISAFYTGYRKTVLRPGEFIRAVRIPKLQPGARFAAYKLTKRFDQDISAVCAAFHVDASGKARFGFGGMAATPARAPSAEKAYEQGVVAACAALAVDFAPLSDHRASAWYRLAAAQNLLRKFHARLGPRALLELEA